MSIRYKPGSFAPFFCKSEMEALIPALKWELPTFAYDVTYASHIEQFNGGTPQNAHFMAASGVWHTIERFLNFSDVDLIGDDALLSLNVNVAWSAIDDRLGVGLVPFAACGCGDYLCFDYRGKVVRPRVVLWINEESDINRPSTVEVAENFDEFVSGLWDESTNH